MSSTWPGLSTDVVVERVVYWQRLDQPGGERCELHRTPDGWGLGGSVTLFNDGKPLSAEYRIACDDAWRMTHALIVQRDETGTRMATIDSDAKGRWRLDGVDILAVLGCADIDLEVSPATNTLPIRRLGLEIGQSADVSAAWVRFPSLTIEQLSQRYTRLTSDRFRYESDTGFVAELVFDDLGLVVDYPGVWSRP